MAGKPRYFGLATTSIDPKNRITIPAKFRGRLPVTGDGKIQVFVSIGPDFRHLAIFDAINGEQRIEELTGGENLPDAEQRKRQQLLAYMEPVEVDKQGRVLLPKDHVAYAQLKGEVVVSGAGNHMQVYDPQEARAASAPVSIETLDPQTVAEIFNSTLPEQG